MRRGFVRLRLFGAMVPGNERFYLLRWWLVVGVALLTGALSAWVSNRSLVAQQRHVQSSLVAYGTLTEVQNLVSVLKDAEAGQRGYLLTGNRDYLEPYDAALRSLPGIVRRIESLTRDDAMKQAEVQQIWHLSEAKLSELGETIQIRRTAGLARALEGVDSGRGAVIMDQLRTLLDKIEGQIHSDLQQAIDRETAAEANARAVIRACFIALLGLFVIAISVISRNFRHRADAEERDRQAKLEIIAGRRYHDLMEAAPDGILEVDSEGSIILLNAAAEQLFGYSKEELLGKPVDDLVPERVRAGHAVHRGLYGATAGTRAMGRGLELTGLRKDGTRFPVEISLSPVSSPVGVHVAAVIRDVGERKRSEERIRAIQDEFTTRLAAANRELEVRNIEVEGANRLKSEFLANMSHELRTPLHTVIGFAELLSEEVKGPLNTDQQRFVGHINKDANHLLSLINDLLDLSKIEEGKLELKLATLDLQGMVEDTLSSVRPQAATKRITIDTCVPASMFIEGDRTRLRQILFNLMSNAIKFTPERGKVRVEAVQSRSFAEISVSDTGVGIPQEEQGAVFDKFYQVGSGISGVHGGTGLGLPITRQLVEGHGGRIWLRSEPGKGSCFIFTIPLSHRNEMGVGSG